MKIDLDLPANMEAVLDHASKSGIQPTWTLQVGLGYTDLRITWCEKKTEKKNTGTKTPKRRGGCELTRSPNLGAPAMENKVGLPTTGNIAGRDQTLKRKKKSPSTRRRNHRRRMEYIKRRRARKVPSHSAVSMDTDTEPSAITPSTPPLLNNTKPPSMIPRPVALRAAQTSPAQTSPDKPSQSPPPEQSTARSPSPILEMEINTADTATAPTDEDDIYNKTTVLDNPTTTAEENNDTENIPDTDTDNKLITSIGPDSPLHKYEHFFYYNDPKETYSIFIYGWMGQTTYLVTKQREEDNEYETVSKEELETLYDKFDFVNLRNQTMKDNERTILQESREEYVTSELYDTDSDTDSDSENDNDNEEPAAQETTQPNQTDLSINQPEQRTTQRQSRNQHNRPVNHPTSQPKTQTYNRRPSDILIKKFKNTSTEDGHSLTSFYLLRPDLQECVSGFAYSGFIYKKTTPTPVYKSTRIETGAKYELRHKYITDQMNRSYVNITNNNLYSEVFKSLLYISGKSKEEADTDSDTDTDFSSISNEDETAQEPEAHAN